MVEAVLLEDVPPRADPAKGPYLYSGQCCADYGVPLMTNKDGGRLEVEDHGSVLLVRVDGGKHGLFGLDIATQLDELIDRADADPDIHAAVFHGSAP